jgi:hypothetical protein
MIQQKMCSVNDFLTIMEDTRNNKKDFWTLLKNIGGIHK